MKRSYLAYLLVPFWASPKNTMFEYLQTSGDSWKGRNAQHGLFPGFPRYDTPLEQPPQPVRPIPTDVPVPEPMDVPVPEPRDVPVPDPGAVPEPAKPRPDEINPKPRSVP